MAERTEQATPKRLEEARRRGQVALGRDLPSALVVLAVTGVLVAAGGGAVARLGALFELIVRAIARVGASPVASGGAVGSSRGAFEALEVATSVGVTLAFPVLATALVAGTLGYVLQTGPLFAPRALEPRLDRFDLVEGAARLVSWDALLEALRALLKVGVIGWVAWATLRGGMRPVLALGEARPDEVLAVAGALLAKLGVRTGGALLAVAVLEVLYRRWKHQRDLRMTREEVRREAREAEGDPHAKQERQRAHQETVAYSSVEAARTATVVVVNPTHLAVALKYDEQEMEAPRVVAKGEDDVARRLVAAAREAGVPVMRDVPLARSLFDLEIGDEIPEALYEAVAAVLHAAAEEEERA